MKTDVTVAKNYLQKEELAELNEIVTMYLGLCNQTGKKTYSDDNGRLEDKA